MDNGDLIRLLTNENLARQLTDDGDNAMCHMCARSDNCDDGCLYGVEDWLNRKVVENVKN